VFTIEITLWDFTVYHIVFKDCEPVADSEIALHDVHLDYVFPNDLHDIDGECDLGRDFLVFPCHQTRVISGCKAGGVRTLVMLALEVLHTGCGEADVGEGGREGLEFGIRQPFLQVRASWANLASLRLTLIKLALSLSIAAIFASLAGVG
jgi:hypothetical protein